MTRCDPGELLNKCQSFLFSANVTNVSAIGLFAVSTQISFSMIIFRFRCKFYCSVIMLFCYKTNTKLGSRVFLQLRHLSTHSSTASLHCTCVLQFSHRCSYMLSNVIKRPNLKYLWYQVQRYILAVYPSFGSWWSAMECRRNYFMCSHRVSCVADCILFPQSRRLFRREGR